MTGDPWQVTCDLWNMRRYLEGAEVVVPPPDTPAEVPAPSATAGGELQRPNTSLVILPGALGDRHIVAGLGHCCRRHSETREVKLHFPAYQGLRCRGECPQYESSPTKSVGGERS